MANSSCIFCDIVNGKIKSERVDESDSFIAIRDTRPAVEGHTLIIPKEHFVTLLDIPDKLGEEMLMFTKKVASELTDASKGEGFNVLMNNFGSAGQLVKHAHVHLIPRKEGDGVRFLTRV